MSGIDRNDALQKSLSMLDAVLGTPSTPPTHQRQFNRRSIFSNQSLDISATLEGRPPADDFFNTTHDQTGINSAFDSSSFIQEEVTLPAVPHYGTDLTNMTLNNTTAALLTQDDPGHKATQVLFSEFVNIFVSHPSEAQLWQEVTEYERICAQQTDALARIIRKAPRQHANFVRTQQMYLQMIGERNTWRLIGSLYNERVNEENGVDDLPMTDDTDVLLTDQTVVTQLYDNNSTIREAQIVIDWLEKNAADDLLFQYFDRVEHFGDSHIAWENTMKNIKTERDQAGGRHIIGLSGIRPLVTSIDPDAPLRQGRPLHDLDQEDETRLVRCLFGYIRAGEIEKAQELSMSAGQHWRAATLEGWKLYHDSNPSDPSARNPIAGNPYRDVWKAVAWRAASDQRLPSYERASYGALCGNLSAMLEVCNGWEDQVWAHMRTLVDQRVEEQLRGSSKHLRPLHPLPKDYPEERFTMLSVFDSVERSVELTEHNNPYRTIQKYLILDDIDSLIRTSHNWSKENPAPHLLRCLTHLLLILRRLGRIPIDLNEQATDILHACVKEAQERGDVEQVAWYASVLPEWLQVRCYANFLTNISDDHHRRHALSLAGKVGLDTGAITTTVVATIRLTAGTDGGEGELLADTTADDRAKISAIDWLLYHKSQRSEALRQGNAIMRSFLISRKLTAAKAIFNKLPSDSIDCVIQQHEADTGSTNLSPSLDKIIREYLCIRTFLDAQDSFTDWFDHYHQKKPRGIKKPPEGCNFSEQIAYDHALQQYNGEYERWQNTLKALSKATCDKLYNILLFPDGGWLIDQTVLLGDLDEDDDNIDGTEFSLDKHLDPELASQEPNRSHQLTTLRSVYIPQVTSLLQNILHSTENYKECIRLADIIASELHSLYKTFAKGELERFLLKLQETSRELLDRNCDALGYPLQ